MRRGHARAAVLLGGWLLLFPRPKETTENKLALDIEAPLSQWEQVGAFDSQAKCRRARTVALAGKVVSTEKEAKTGERLPLPADARDSRFSLSRCVPAEHVHPPKEPKPK